MPLDKGVNLRGFLGLLILAVLTDGEAHGYRIMKRIEEMTGGAWRPAPGSLYPLLSYLESEGLITCGSRGDGGKKVCRLTREGLQYFIDVAVSRVRVLGSIVAELLVSICRAYNNSGRCEETRELIEELVGLMSSAARRCSTAVPQVAGEAARPSVERAA